MQEQVNSFIIFHVPQVGTQLQVALTVYKSKGQEAVCYFLHLSYGWLGHKINFFAKAKSLGVASAKSKFCTVKRYLPKGSDCSFCFLHLSYQSY